jgi:hypothetical protein
VSIAKTLRDFPVCVMDAASSVNAQWSNARLSNFSGIDGRMNGRAAPVTAKPIGGELC